MLNSKLFKSSFTFLPLFFLTLRLDRDEVSHCQSQKDASANRHFLIEFYQCSEPVRNNTTTATVLQRAQAAIAPDFSVGDLLITILGSCLSRSRPYDDNAIESGPILRTNGNIRSSRCPCYLFLGRHPWILPYCCLHCRQLCNR